MIKYTALFERGTDSSWSTTAMQVFYSSDAPADEVTILSGEVVQQVNGAGTFDFSVTQDNVIAPYTRDSKIYSSLIQVLRDVDGTKECIFKGRPSSVSVGNNNVVSVKCNGLFADLSEIVIEPFEYSGTLTGYFSALLSKINAADFSRSDIVSAGTVSVVTDSIITKEVTSLYDGMTLLKDLTSAYGGRLVPSYGTTSATTFSLSWLSSATETSGQIIGGAYNLVSISTETITDDMTTGVLPVGNNNLYLDNVATATQQADGTYRYKRAVWLPDALPSGKSRMKTAKYDTDSQTELLALATADLRKQNSPKTQTEIRAVDMSYIDGCEPFRLFRRVRVSSPKHQTPHGIDHAYTITKIVIDLVDPTSSEVVVDDKQPTLTQQTNGAQNRATYSTSSGSISSQSESYPDARERYY